VIVGGQERRVISNLRAELEHVRDSRKVRAVADTAMRKLETGDTQKCHEALDSLLIINAMALGYGWVFNVCPRMSATWLDHRVQI
jgi:hypothetical protein